MTKDSAKELLNNPALKLVAMVVTVAISVGGSLHLVLKRIDRIETKMDTYIATQKGVDDVQNVLTLVNTNDIINVKEEFADVKEEVRAFVSKEGTLPKKINIESE